MSLIISNYNLLKDSVESEFTISFNMIENQNIKYILKYPSNPILDCQIINLHEKPIELAIQKIILLIEEDEFGLQSRIELIQFKNWISKIIALFLSKNLGY